LLFGSEVMVLADYEDERVTALRMSDGEELWTIDDELGGAILPGIDGTAGLIFLPLGDDENETTAVDLTSGEELYTLEVSDDGNWQLSIIGMNTSLMYLQGNEDAELIAVETRTGDEAWSLDSPKANWYDYAVLGGNLVAYLSGSSVESNSEEPALRGLQP
jgi:outer membrane protein assembly factor BamB